MSHLPVLFALSGTYPFNPVFRRSLRPSLRWWVWSYRTGLMIKARTCAFTIWITVTPVSVPTGHALNLVACPWHLYLDARWGNYRINIHFCQEAANRRSALWCARGFADEKKKDEQPKKYEISIPIVSAVLGTNFVEGCVNWFVSSMFYFNPFDIRFNAFKRLRAHANTWKWLTWTA